MKEFEKFVKNNFGKLESDSRVFGSIFWKAALESINKHCEELDETCCLDCGCFNMVSNLIEEELEE